MDIVVIKNDGSETQMNFSSSFTLDYTPSGLSIFDGDKEIVRLNDVWGWWRKNVKDLRVKREGFLDYVMNIPRNYKIIRSGTHFLVVESEKGKIVCGFVFEEFYYDDLVKTKERVNK